MILINDNKIIWELESHLNLSELPSVIKKSDNILIIGDEIREEEGVISYYLRVSD